MWWVLFLVPVLPLIAFAWLLVAARRDVEIVETDESGWLEDQLDRQDRYFARADLWACVRQLRSSTAMDEKRWMDELKGI